MSHRLGLTALLVALAAALPSSASAATNLGAFWQLNEASGTAAIDSSGNANHGTVNGATSVAGRFQRSLRFDGVDDSVAFARSASLEPATVTVEGWVRAGTAPGSFKYIVSQGAYLCEVASYGLYTGAGGGVAFYVSNGSVDQSAISPAAPATVWDGAWHHVAGTYDGTTARLFVDGTEIGAGTASTIPIGYGLPNPAGQLGAFGGTCTLNWGGDLDEPRIWRRALTGQELAASAAMGGPATERLGQRIDATQAITYTAEFSDGDDIQISTESSTGTEKIKAIKLNGLLPLSSRVTCRDGLRSLLDSSCSFTLSNGGRTARVDVDPLLGEPTATLRVTVTSGRTFDVVVDTSGGNAGIRIQAEVHVSVGS